MGAILSLCKVKRPITTSEYFNKPIIFALSNPGKKYTFTKHNVGKLFVDWVAWKYDIENDWKTFKYGDVLETEKFILLKSKKYMNQSAGALDDFLTYHESLENKIINEENLIIACDYQESKFGNTILRYGGSHKGHNGIKSIYALAEKSEWDTEKIPKQLIGISRPKEREPSIVANWVLSEFTPEELQTLKNTIFPQAMDKIKTDVLKEPPQQPLKPVKPPKIKPEKPKLTEAEIAELIKKNKAKKIESEKAKLIEKESGIDNNCSTENGEQKTKEKKTKAMKQEERKNKQDESQNKPEEGKSKKKDPKNIDENNCSKEKVE